MNNEMMSCPVDGDSSKGLVENFDNTSFVGDATSNCSNTEEDYESDYFYTDEEEEDSGDDFPESSTTTEPAPSPVMENHKPKWTEPSTEAVCMSIRAEQEKSGGRRRLASDLYKIMSSSTHEAGFTLSPADEDSMDKWCIKLFDFDEDSNLAKDLLVIGLNCVELEMTFPEQYPFEPPFVRVVRPRFRQMTGFVMDGALCMELLTKDGWNPINDIESVIVSIRSLMVIGGGRVKAAVEMSAKRYEEMLMVETERRKTGCEAEEKVNDRKDGCKKEEDADKDSSMREEKEAMALNSKEEKKMDVGSYSAAEASRAFNYLSKLHQEEGWDKKGWWAKRG